MRLLADENLAGAKTLFSPFGNLRTMPGRQISRAQVEAADVLLLRSVTRVSQALVENTAVQFVGTATIGTDHVDLETLRRFGIAFASAPGCNAQAVADYVLAAVFAWCKHRGRDARKLSIGIVGLGHVGRAVEQRFARLGCRVLVNDPPAANRGEVTSSDLDQILGCDVVTLHVPLSQQGQHATQGMIGADQLASLCHGQCLINAARGGVVDEAALKRRLKQADPPDAIIDTWENEPEIDPALLADSFIATPHIAGYSLEGRIRGSWMIHEALCRHLGRSSGTALSALLPPAVRLNYRAAAGLPALVRTAYDINADDQRFRRFILKPDGFDQMRRTYPMRREFASYRLDPGLPTATALGFDAADTAKH